MCSLIMCGIIHESILRIEDNLYTYIDTLKNVNMHNYYSITNLKITHHHETIMDMLQLHSKSKSQYS